MLFANDAIASFRDSYCDNGKAGFSRGGGGDISVILLVTIVDGTTRFRKTVKFHLIFLFLCETTVSLVEIYLQKNKA